jgi:hypothetical protein
VHAYTTQRSAGFDAVDPIEGETRTNDYGYVVDPLNEFDSNGMGCGWNPLCHARHVVKAAAHAALDTAAFIPYTVYYGSYQVRRKSPLGLHWSVELPLATSEAAGLGGDVAIDWIKGHSVSHESIRDEGLRRYINPFHQWMPSIFRGPQVSLPGVHANGRN